MKLSLVMLAAAALPLSACTSTYGDNDTLASAGTGAAIGAAAGAGVSAIAGTDLLTSAAIGAAAGGLAGAVWADRDRDGRADGYVYQNQYYQGTPASYQAGTGTPYCSNPSVGGTALKTGVAGAAVGAGAGALIGGISVLEGAAIGAAVGGLGGAIWADQNRDGCVDGYVMENGQYYPGAPAQQQPATTSYTGERG